MSLVLWRIYPIALPLLETMVRKLMKSGKSKIPKGIVMRSHKILTEPQENWRVLFFGDPKKRSRLERGARR